MGQLRDADAVSSGVGDVGINPQWILAGYHLGMAVTEVPDLALLDNETRQAAYRTQAKVLDLDAHPSFRPMVAKLVEQYKVDRPELFTDEHR